MGNGRSTVRGTLVFVLALSMAANVGHTILAQSAIPAWLRMIGAVCWPLLVFLAVEILVRVIWQPRASHRWARALILFPAIPAAVTSYEHMHAVLLAMGERPFIAAIGPAAIDVMMIGCTLTLLFTRQAAPQSAPIVSAPEQATLTEQEAERIFERYAAQTVDELPYVPTPAELELAEQMAAAELLEQPRERTPRAGSEGAQKAIALLLDGREKEAVSAGLMGASTMRRYVRVKTMLRDTPALAIDCRQEKVRPELVDMIREWANDGRPYV